MALVDVVVVSYNNRRHLRASVEPLCRLGVVHVTVVDNASSDDSLETVADLPVSILALPDNRGFAAGCNAGWRSGEAPFVLLLNPDARIDAGSLERLAGVLQADKSVGVVAPRIIDGDGSLDFSQRRFPRLRSTYAQALFLHRLFRRAAWTDEVVRDETAYASPGSSEWVSGACMLIRRSALEQLGGLDDGFFMYCEDKDLCRRARDAGFEVRYEPAAVCQHEGGASAPRPALLPVLAESRVRFAVKHQRSLPALLERVGIGLGALTHALVGRGGKPVRKGHARALRTVIAGNGLGPARGTSRTDSP